MQVSTLDAVLNVFKFNNEGHNSSKRVVLKVWTHLIAALSERKCANIVHVGVHSLVLRKHP